MRTKVILVQAVTLLSLVGLSLRAHDRRRQEGPREPPPAEGPRLLGTAELTRPDPPVDEDARGSALLHQRGERKALHVHVRKLAPGTTYEVTASLGDKTETIGNITTRGNGPDRPPRVYLARLTGAEESPPVETEGRGFASFILNRDRTELRYHAFARSLSGPLIAAHIHQGAPGEKGDVILPLDHETLRGTLAVTPEQVALLASGGAYINLHTEMHPDGEVRGQIKPLVFPWSSRSWRAGSGSLRLDTERVDALPFGAASIADLKGMAISVLDGEKKVVLAGAFAEIKDLNADDDGGMNGEGGRGGVLGEEPSPAPDASDPLFAMDDEHDASFIRGDANDDRRFDISDPVVVLSQLFQGGAPGYCQDAADANDDGKIEITDPIAMLSSLFRSQGGLPAPFPAQGFDPTADELFCDQ